MDINEAREHVRTALRHVSEGRLEDAVELCSSVLPALPRDGTAQQELVSAYETLVWLRFEQGLKARAMRTYRQYLQDCAPACDAAYDGEYEAGLDAAQMSPVPLSRRERFWSLLRLFEPALGLDGLAAECGCFRGLSSFLMCRRIRLADAAFDGRGYRIFDSFAGLSAPGPDDTVEDSLPNAGLLRQATKAGKFSATIAEVKRTLAEFPRIQFYPGWIPEAFPDDTAARYRFVHVDVDLYQPTRDCLEYFYPRLVPGGRLVCDDYGWPGARKAVDDFCARVGEEITTTAHQQACIVRRN